MQVQIDVLAVVLAGIGSIVWLVRLEGRINHLEKYSQKSQKDIDELRTKHDALDDKLLNRLADVEKSLARIEGSLGMLRKQDKE